MPAVAEVGLSWPKSRNASPTACVTVNVGIVAAGALVARSPAVLLAMTTATAPAAAALSTLIDVAQVPRRRTAIAPANVPAPNGEQPSSAVPMNGLMRSGVAVGIDTVNGTPSVLGVRSTAPSSAGTGAGPVTLIASANTPRPCWTEAVLATHGARWPTLLAAGPSLPAEVAT